jgi:hypothetical protein
MQTRYNTTKEDSDLDLPPLEQQLVGTQWEDRVAEKVARFLHSTVAANEGPGGGQVAMAIDELLDHVKSAYVRLVESTTPENVRDNAPSAGKPDFLVIPLVPESQEVRSTGPHHHGSATGGCLAILNLGNQEGGNTKEEFVVADHITTVSQGPEHPPAS